MKSKKDVGTTKKVLDISRPKKRPAGTEAPSAPLVIPKRSIIVPISDSGEESEPIAMPTKRVAKSVEPTTAPDLESLASQPAEVKDSVEPEAADKPAPEAPVSVEPDTVPKPPEPAQPEEPAKAEKPTPKPDIAPAAPAPSEPAETPSDTEEAEETSTPDDAESPDVGSPADATATGSKAGNDENNPAVRKALEDAKREQEIQGYIDKHEFFVPINSIARKRSIKVTIILIFVEIILGLFLLNLMLDAGLIYLLEKVPHTHFFNLQ